MVNTLAGGVSEEDERLLQERLPGFELRRLEEGQNLQTLLRESELAEDAVVVVAGGDGTVAAAARLLAGTGRRLGIVPLGTFNNFARALQLPLDAGDAASALMNGREATVKLGRVNGEPFLEVAALGLFGDLVSLGEAVKELAYGDLLEQVRHFSSASFDYRISGDVEKSGRARAIVVANTPSTGAHVPVGDADPEEPVLELTVFRGLLRRRHRWSVRRVRIETDPAVAVHADADRAGETPADIGIDADALKVLLPR